jgi:uncharacterized protein (TIGR02246 family)
MKGLTPRLAFRTWTTSQVGCRSWHRETHGALISSSLIACPSLGTYYLGMFWRTLLLIVVSAPALGQKSSSRSADLIRSMRQEIDQAFQRHDAKQLAALFSSDCRFTTPSAQIDGSGALERFNTSLFTKRPDVIFTHRANRIVVNENWDLASEQGDWIERWTDKDGVTELRGAYMTMWKRAGGRWREYSEIIVPETCSGSSYCH